MIKALAQPLHQAQALNAIMSLEMELTTQASASDERRRKGILGVLEGVPITVKDNIALSGWPTTGGTPSLQNYNLAEGEAVGRLREAGAIITGKTNLHELAFGITGENAHTGAVRNPFDQGRLAGGSSSGAAVCVAVGACAIAIGTDTGGSCRIPAAHCGIVGFRPSTYRYPIDGYLRLSPSRDTLGILARNVCDVALADAVIAPERPAREQVQLAGLRIGVVRVEPCDAAVWQAFEDGLARLRSAGAELVSVDLTQAIAADEAGGFVIALYETARSIAALAQAACGQTLAEFTTTIASDDVRATIASQCGADAVPPEAYAEAVTMHLPRLRHAFAQALSQVDVLAYPTTPIVAPMAGAGDMAMVGDVTMPVFPAYTLMTRADSMAGVPTISLPCGLAGGLPTGFQLAGRAGQDRRLLAIAEAVEAAFPKRPVPPDLKEFDRYD